MPRSSILVGGLTLSLLAIPIIIITTRNSLRAVPYSIRQAVKALGATDLQLILHHIIPLSMPGIITGIILSISRIIGETAPLLIIGMVAFVSGGASGILSAATVLPAQLFLWSNNPEQGFEENTAAAILILIIILSVANILANLIRKKYEVKW